ncbi:MAG: choline kinase [Pseudomonadales bacterium]|jgi:choline kinase
MTKNKITTAIILAAGVGSRIRPLTDNCPKCLLTIDGKTIIERMITNTRECGIDDFVVVLGYLEDQIRDFIAVTFPDLKVSFIVNELYAETNTGYSLMLAADAVQGRGFVKFDADVVFDKTILNNLMDSDFETCLCVDTNIQLDAEEIKVAIHENNRITHASKTLDPNDAIGESIGIEKISQETATILFNELRLMMEDQSNHQEYYEAAYERLIEQDVPFFALDITGLKWVEIDTQNDFSEAARLFQTTEVFPFNNYPSPQPSIYSTPAVG